MLLHYEPRSQLALEVKNHGDHKEEWNSEQIRDFVRKLGFMDKEKADGGAQIKRFLSLNQVKYTLCIHGKIYIAIDNFFNLIDCIKAAGFVYEAK